MNLRRPYLEIPILFDRSPPVVSLEVELRRPDALVYAIRLWEWRQRFGERVEPRSVVLVIERAARWRGRRGKLFDALLRSGIIVRDGEGVRIVDPLVLIPNPFFNSEKSKPKESKEERRRRKDRERQARRRYPSFDLLMERDGRACRYCRATKRLSVDHVVPRKQGGSDDPENLVIACLSCNCRKGARTPEEAGMRLLNPPAKEASRA